MTALVAACQARASGSPCDLALDQMDAAVVIVNQCASGQDPICDALISAALAAVGQAEACALDAAACPVPENPVSDGKTNLALCLLQSEGCLLDRYDLPATVELGQDGEFSQASSCQQTDVALRAYDYGGDYRVTHQAARTTESREHGGYTYKINYIVPYFIRPGAGTFYTDTRCGDPNAAPSPDVEVEITRAKAAIVPSSRSARPGQKINFTGTKCYGDDDGHVDIAISGAVQDRLTAELSQQRFAFSWTVPRQPGQVTFKTGAADCSGSSEADAAVDVVSAATAGAVRSTSRPRADGTPRPVVRSPAPSTVPSTVSAPSVGAALPTFTDGPDASVARRSAPAGDPPRDSQLGAFLILAVGAFVAAAGTGIRVRRRRLR